MTLGRLEIYVFRQSDAAPRQVAAETVRYHVLMSTIFGKYGLPHLPPSKVTEYRALKAGDGYQTAGQLKVPIGVVKDVQARFVPLETVLQLIARSSTFEEMDSVLHDILGVFAQQLLSSVTAALAASLLYGYFRSDLSGDDAHKMQQSPLTWGGKRF